MAVTRTWESALTAKLAGAQSPAKPIERRREFFWLSGASLVVACGLVAVFFAKTQDFPELQERLQRGELLNVNTLQNPDQLLPALQMVADGNERAALAQQIYDYSLRHKPLPNVGALAHVRLPNSDAHTRLMPLARLKPLLIVRTPREFTRSEERRVGK